MNEFEIVINAYLDSMAVRDAAFAERYGREDKSIEKCCEYIIGEVRASGRSGFADEEIYGMAVHYYDEDNVTIRPASAEVVVNHAIELTEEEKAEARRRAQKHYELEEYRRLKEEEDAKRAKKQSKTKDAKPKQEQEQEKKPVKKKSSAGTELMSDLFAGML